VKPQTYAQQDRQKSPAGDISADGARERPARGRAPGQSAVGTLR